MIDASKARAWLEDKDLRVIEARTGLHYSVLWRIKNGRVRELSNKTAEALEPYLNA